ncbi:YdcH family protein [Rhizobiaceae bacterium BDR2-2]|uniref:YdcH family protein n=1 Tax=Ectorhizobium quercum TaxID=2965071 RepID=A0AAE3N277_9HYPH|nr:YdcH family protein [Ectorhizobium quercum]MCX8998861.1 YdcH family protein [Ectorhizobium quercum]
MSNTPHTLGEEFPDQIEAIHALKARDARFAKILAEYDEVNDQIHRSESRIDTLSEEAENVLRKRRLTLKDTIAGALATQ